MSFFFANTDVDPGDLFPGMMAEMVGLPGGGFTHKLSDVGVDLLPGDPGFDPVFGVPTFDETLSSMAPVPEEDPGMTDEKKAVAQAARDFRTRQGEKRGRSSTFLTRGLNLGRAPARTSFLTGRL